MHPLTIICTSCDRFDLLEQTLDSFFALNNYLYVAFHIHNDSVNSVPIELKEKYKKKDITWHEGVKRGLGASWDYLINLVETEYFFNLEDDWLFQGNANFIVDGIDILETDMPVNQVWIRNIKDHKHPLSEITSALINNLNSRIIQTDFKHVIPTKDWCGFSFNPSVRRLSDWKKFFTNGIAGKDEIELSRELMGKYYAVSLVNSACKHNGWNRHTQDFKI